MSSVGLNLVVGQAVISDSFRHGLLNGRRAEMLRQFQDALEPEETAAVMAIAADDLVAFSVAVENFIRERDGRQPLLAEAPLRQAVRWPSLALTGAYLDLKRE